MAKAKSRHRFFTQKYLFVVRMSDSKLGRGFGFAHVFEVRKELLFQFHIRSVVELGLVHVFRLSQGTSLHLSRGDLFCELVTFHCLQSSKSQSFMFLPRLPRSLLEGSILRVCEHLKHYELALTDLTTPLLKNTSKKGRDRRKRRKRRDRKWS